MIVVIWYGAVGRVQLGGGEVYLAPSSKAGP